MVLVQFRCELCDQFLPMLQLSKLCPTCYKIRTIVKCYNEEMILDKLQESFIVNDKLKTKWAKVGGKWIKKEVLKQEEEEKEKEKEEVTKI